jgi:mannose-6-phosphate isomerase-like protein (cupin superfamily)
MTTQIEPVDIARKFDLFTEPWRPKIVGELNESFVKIARLKGEFVWHQHDAEDELFWVIKGTLVIKLRDQDITVRPGQFVIIPKGVEHLPVAAEEVHLVLLEPKPTLNTGSTNSDRTVEAEWI